MLHEGVAADGPANIRSVIEESDREYLAVGDAFHELATAKNRVNAILCAEPDRTLLRRGCERTGESRQGMEQQRLVGNPGRGAPDGNAELF